MKRSLLINQLDEKISGFATAMKNSIPAKGWVNAIRMALGLTLEQLGKKLSMTKQAAYQMELREAEGSITIQSLKLVAESLEMDFVYGFVPKSGTLENYIDLKAEEMAKKIVERTSVSMGLENQLNRPDRIQKAILEKKEEIKRLMPKSLWD